MYLDTLTCPVCEAQLAYHLPTRQFHGVRDGQVVIDGSTWYTCSNRDWSCNWLVWEEASAGRCFSCRLTRRRPESIDTVALEKLAKVEEAKRRLLIQLAVLAFYESVPARRGTPPRYPEIYLFHAGGRFGDFNAFDFWPPRKEVFLPADPAMVLEALNDRAITRLAVPEGMELPERFMFRVIGRDFICAVKVVWRRGSHVGVRIERVGKLEAKPVKQPEVAPAPVETSNDLMPKRGSRISAF